MSQLEMVKLLVDAAKDKKAYDVVALDVQGIAVFTDYFIIARGSGVREYEVRCRRVRTRHNLA